MELHEYAHYDATGLRDLMRAGELSAAEVEAVARQALDVANAELNGLASPPFSPALDHAAHGPFAGVPFLIKDSGPMAEGVPFFIGSRSVRHVVAPHDSELMTPVPGRRSGHIGLDHGAGVGDQLLHRIGQARADPKPVGPAAWCRRIQRWRCRSCRRGRCAARARQRRRRLNPDSRVLLRPGRSQAEPGSHPVRTRHGRSAVRAGREFGLTRTVRDAAHLLDAIHGPGVGDKYTAPPPRGRYADELGLEPSPLNVAVTTQAWSGAAVDPEVAAAATRAARCSRTWVTSSPMRAPPSIGRPSCTAPPAGRPPSPHRSSWLPTPRPGRWKPSPDEIIEEAKTSARWI